MCLLRFLTTHNYQCKGGVDLMEKRQPKDVKVIYTPYVIRNGKRIYPKRAKYFRFFVKAAA